MLEAMLSTKILVLVAEHSTPDGAVTHPVANQSVGDAKQRLVAVNERKLTLTNDPFAFQSVSATHPNLRQACLLLSLQASFFETTVMLSL
jgi:hypothetical protein